MARGVDAVVVVKPQSARGDEVALDGTEFALPLLSESIQAPVTIYGSEALRARALRTRNLARGGTIDVNGSIDLEATNRSLHDLLPLIFPKMTESDDEATFNRETTHSRIYEVSTDDELDYFRMDISDGDVTRTFRDCRVNSFTLSADINQLARMSLDIPGIRPAVSGGVLTARLPEVEYGLYFEQATVQLGNSGGVLTEVPATQFSFNLNRNLNTNRYQLGSRFKRNLPGGVMDMTGSVTMDANPVESDRTMLYNAILETEWLALRLQFIDTVNKVGGEDSKLVIDLPYCLIDWPQHNISGPDFIEGAVNFTVYDDAEAGPTLLHQYVISTD